MIYRTQDEIKRFEKLCTELSNLAIELGKEGIIENQFKLEKATICVNKDEVTKTVEEDLQLGLKTFADKFHTLRNSKKLSMAEVYGLSGVSSSTINDVEKLKYIPNLGVFLKMGYAVGLSKSAVFELLKGNDVKVVL